MTTTLKQRINYTRIALALCNIGVDDQTSELLITVMDEISAKGGDFSVRDAARIQHAIREKYNKQSRKTKTKNP